MLLPEEMAKALDMPLISWHIKSTTKNPARVVYEYDAVSRLRDSQLGDERFMISVITLSRKIVKPLLPKTKHSSD